MDRSLICTAHQPNLLPGLSMVEKIRASDAVIWLDDVQFTRHGFTNRQRMPDGSWLTVPLQHKTLDGPIRAVRIDYSKPWITKHTKTLRQHYGDASEPFIAELQRRPSRLITLNFSLLERIPYLGARWYLQTQFGTAGPISEQLARMAKQIDATVYLSGPSGRSYLDEEPFRIRGIDVLYWKWDRPNPCVLESLTHRLVHG